MEQHHQSSVSMGASSSSTACHANITTTQTILRIKRRRTEDPVPCLRLEGVAPSVPRQITGGTLNLEEENYLQQQQQQQPSSSSKKRSSAVLWKRLDPETENTASTANANRYRIVNAMFVDTTSNSKEDEEETLEPEQQTRIKRRKLTVLNTATTIADENGNNFANNNDSMVTSPLHSLLFSDNHHITTTNTKKTKKHKQTLKILDPLTRLVDDSLQQVLAGTRTCQAHFLLLTQDTRLTLQPAEQQHRWMTWCSSGNNILHCCALWNDPVTAHDLLQHAAAAAAAQQTIIGKQSLQEVLVEATDDDGRTPYEVAQVVGHHAVCQVLEAHGGDTTNYVYDIFYLDNVRSNVYAEEDDDEYRDSPVHDTAAPMMTAELTSGVGYWTPEGELVLEADEKNARSLSHETDGDIDSNCEEYGGNDYPDEEEEGLDSDVVGSARRWMDQMAYSDYNDEGYVDDGYDEYHGGEDENGKFLQVNDNYDEYDWEEDLGDSRQYAMDHPYDYEDDE